MGDNDMPVFQIAGRRGGKMNAVLAAIANKPAPVPVSTPEPAEYVKVTMKKSGDAYAMNAKTHEVRRLVPKQFRSKKERVRARRALNGQR